MKFKSGIESAEHTAIYLVLKLSRELLEPVPLCPCG
jgi:hypothetical protein